MPRHQMVDAVSAMGFVTAQREHIEAGVNRAPLRGILYPSLVPVDTSANPFTQTVTYLSSEDYGQAEWINGNADDIPLVGSKRSRKSTPVYTAAIGYGYGWEEINVAMMLGQNLEADDAFTARRAADEMIDRVAIWQGDAAKGMHPLIDHPSVTPGSAVNGDWDNATEDEMLEDINDALNQTFIDTNEFSIADTILLPAGKINKLGMTRLSGTTMTALQFLRQNNVYTLTTGAALTIRAIPGLSTAGVGGTARLIAYRRDPEVLKMHLPMPHRFLPVWQAGPLRWEVPGVMRLGGLDIRRPSEVTYRDGL